MVFDKTLFGREIKAIREKSGFTREDVYVRTGVSKSSLNRIETGKVQPRTGTLECLSELYDTDLFLVHDSCLISEMAEYNRVMQFVELSQEKYGLEEITQYQKVLNGLIVPQMNRCCQNIIRQTICLLNGSKETIQRNYDAAYSFFLRAIQMTVPEFNLENYTKHRYKKQELQLLMDIAVAKNRISQNILSLEMLDFCVNFFEKESNLTGDVLGTKIYISASYENHLNKFYEKALRFAEKGIDYNNLIRSQYAMGQLYARKGYAEYRLDRNEHLDSFKKAVEYFRMFGQIEMEKAVLRDIQEHFGIIIAI